jgi:hypothetical protein
MKISRSGWTKCDRGDGGDAFHGGRAFIREEKTMADYSVLKAHLRGELIQAGDSNYDDARKLYNAMIDKGFRRQADRFA